MTDIKHLQQQILEHLKLYVDLGVRWIRLPDARKQTASGSAEKRVTPSATAPRKNPVSSVHKPVVYSSMFDPLPSVEETLDAIRTDLGDCRRCKLSPTRKNIVFGSGNPNAELMFVGEAPGADEDDQGLPFVGRAGQLLTRIIEAIGMRRDEVYICNIVKCRPPGNRNPETDEITACQSFLFRQVAAVKPKVICALGAYGAQALLQTREAIGKLRGQLMEYRGSKLMATFHPAYLLRNPNEKRKVWEDMQIIRSYLRSFRAGAPPTNPEK